MAPRTPAKSAVRHWNLIVWLAIHRRFYCRKNCYHCCSENLAYRKRKKNGQPAITNAVLWERMQMTTHDVDVGSGSVSPNRCLERVKLGITDSKDEAKVVARQPEEQQVVNPG